MLTQSTSTGIQFEVQVPLDSLSLNSSNEGGQTYTQVNLPGAAATAEVGEPQLPLMSQLLAVPFGVEIELKIQPGKSRVVEIENPVLPVPSQTIDWLLPDSSGSLLDAPQAQLLYEPNQEIYTADRSYPGKLGEIVNDGVIRQQRVVSVALYPVQYNPSRSELTLYENISVSLSFKGGVQTAKSSFEQESTAYEELFRQKLLNYSTSHAWRLPVSQQELPETNQTLLSGLNTLPWTPPDPAWRIKVREEGVHRITYADLSEAGLDVDNIIPRTFRMFYKGQEIAVKVEGEEDESFDVADNILFLAEPLENKYSLDNVYWLTYGSVDGSRMHPRSSEVPTNPAETHFIDRKNFESNNSYVTYPSGDDDFERFLWVDFYAYGGNPGIWEYSLPLNQPVNDPEADCILDLDLLGFSILPQGHQAKIFVNDLLLGELIWQGRTWSHLSTTFSSEHLLPVNTLKITLPNDQGALLDWIYVDRFSLRCPLGFRVQNNTLDFSFDLDGSNRFDLEGFNTNSLYLFDTSDPGNPQFLTDFQVQADGLEYTLSFQEAAEVSGEHSYLAVGTQAMKQVHAIEQDTPTTLEDPLNGADHLIITHADFLVPAQTLADYRQSQGLRAVVVNVQDIYDQFGYGIVGKDPIHAFLSYAYQNWAAPAPTYVVLMGDGHYNPKGYNLAEYGAWRESFIPPYLAYADPALGETAADNRYVTFDGEGDMLPDMMLGRMAVMTADQASAFVNKIMAYEQNPSTIDWQTPVLAVADNSDYGGNFPSISQFLISSSLPEEYQPQRVYLGVTHSEIADAKVAIVDAINNGKFLVNYIGHGAERQWADGEGFLATGDVAGLTNLNKYPIISAMTCKEGYYINPHAAGSDYESLAEVITRAENKGAVASWSPTGNSVATGHDIINRELFVAIFSDLVPRVGQATQQSLLDLWASGTYLDLIDTYLLFGDPSIVFKRGLTAVSDDYELDESTVLNVIAPGVLGNEINPDGLPLTAQLVPESGPSNGTLTFNSNGSFTYTPTPGWNGLDRFSYRAVSGTTQSNATVVNLLVKSTNRVPTTVADNYTFDEDTALVVSAANGVLKNDTDADGDPLTAELYNTATRGVLQFQADGSFNYYPYSSVNGADSFTYRAKDNESVSVVTTVTLNITPVNDVPVAFADNYSTGEGLPLTIPAPGVLGNDFDPEGDSLTAVLVPESGPANGVLDLNANGSFTYTPNANFVCGDSFSYQAYDGKAYSAPAVVTITVTPGGDTPVVCNDSYTLEEDGVLVLAAPGVLGNDYAPNRYLLTAELTVDASHGLVSLQPDGSFSYTPEVDYFGSDSFSYLAKYDSEPVGEGVVSLVITPLNDAPVVADIPDQTIAEGATFTTVDLSKFVTDIDNPTTDLSWSFAGNTQLSVNIINQIATITAPNPDWYGEEVITFKATDPDGAFDVDIAMFKVTPVNDAPVVADIPDQTITKGQAFTTINLDAYVSDVDNTATEMTWSLIGNVNLSVSIVNRVATITAPPDWSGSESITFRATDPDNAYDEDAATFTVKVGKLFLPIIFR